MFPIAHRYGARAIALGALTLLAACGDAPTRPATGPARGEVDGGVVPKLPGRGATAPVGEITPAPRAKWTVMVYLAADNNLAPAGVFDVDEMEAAVAALAKKAAERGAPPGSDVQVVVQAEFSKQYLEQAGCKTPACVRLPSWNTVRFAVTGRDPKEGGNGPTGPVQDLGENRDMTRPEELRDFVRWAKQVRPAEHYMLVLWNHGGGYTGLIADEGSAGNRLMTIDQMRDGLTNVGPIDILDFDMCLMASYETLAKIDGVTKYTVFSEATVPGAGNDYDLLLRVMGLALERGGAAATPQAIAALTADAFHASYEGSRETTTVSAYDLAGFGAFDAKLGKLADAMRARLADEKSAPTYAQAIHDAVAGSQAFDYAQLKDMGNALDSLAAQVKALDDRALAKLIDDVKGEVVAPSFRLRSHARSGGEARALKVDRATGLDILWPSGDANDAIRDSGPSSLEAYEQMLPARPWTLFLKAYLAKSTSATAIDQEDRPLQAFLIWDPKANEQGADVDFWVIEPDGKLYIPFLGRVTPNGQLTADSWDTGNPFEGYATFRFITRGTYYIIANLAQDKNDTRPAYNLAYRFGTEDEFATLYDENLQLSMERSFRGDSTLTFDELQEGDYSDLQLVAEWSPGSADAQSDAGTGRAAGARGDLVPRQRRGASIAAGSRARGAIGAATRPMRPMPRVTPQQLATVRRHLAMRQLRAHAAPRSTFGALNATASLRRLAAPSHFAAP